MGAGPGLGGAAVRAFSQYNGNPVYVAHCTFGGSEDLGDVCSNGSGVSSSGLSQSILRPVLEGSVAVRGKISHDFSLSAASVKKPQAQFTQSYSGNLHL